MPEGDYRTDHPATALLVIEVANSRLGFDRIKKASLCARAGIAEYWIVNLIDGAVEAHSAPSSGTYAQMRTYVAGDSIAVGAFPDVSIAVSELL